MKYILITGASTGIGFTTVQHFLERDFFVFGSVRKQDDADRLQKEFGENFKPLLFDVVDDEAIQKSIGVVKNIIGENGLTALVNNAGIAVSGPIQHVSIGKLNHQLNVNVLGVVRVTQAFLPLLGATENCPHPPGKVVQISSVAGRVAAPFMGPYSASKFALEAISDALRRELVLFNIGVVVIQPGPIKTPIWQKTIAAADEYYEDTPYGQILKRRKRNIEKTEANSIAPEEVAKVIYKSVMSKNPKTRYIVAKRGWMYKIFHHWIPDKLLDRSTTKKIKKYSKK